MRRSGTPRKAASRKPPPKPRPRHHERSVPTRQLQVKGEYITLGQLLKAEGVIVAGGEARLYLEQHSIRVNRQPEDRRGRKLYPGDLVELPGVTVELIGDAQPPPSAASSSELPSLSDLINNHTGDA